MGLVVGCGRFGARLSVAATPQLSRVVESEIAGHVSDTLPSYNLPCIQRTT